VDTTQSDQRRRRARETAELIELASRYYTDGPSYLDSRNTTGVPENHNRVVRASESSWKRHTIPTTKRDGTRGHRSLPLRAVGGEVLVTYADGTTVVKDPSDFRPERATISRAAVTVQNEQQQRRLALLAKVDNASDYNN
jgi:hypothetical protein